MTHDRQNQVYNERNTLAIALARAMLALGYKAGYALDADRLAAGWDKDWGTVVYIDLPDGAQLSYHMNDVTAEAARALPEYEGDWNGKFTGREVPSWLIHMRDLEVLAPSAAVAALTIDAMRDMAAEKKFALVPLYPSREMMRVMDDEGWTWEDLLGAAEAITDEQYADIAANLPDAAPSASVGGA